MKLSFMKLLSLILALVKILDSDDDHESVIVNINIGKSYFA